MSTNKITRTRLTQEQKDNIDAALTNRAEGSTLASIAAENSVSIGAVAQRARNLGLTKIRAPKTDSAAE